MGVVCSGAKHICGAQRWETSGALGGGCRRPAGNDEGDIAAVEEHLSKGGGVVGAVGGGGGFGNILKHHVDVRVETTEGANELALGAQDDPDRATNAAVNQF